MIVKLKNMMWCHFTCFYNELSQKHFTYSYVCVCVCVCVCACVCVRARACAHACVLFPTADLIQDVQRYEFTLCYYQYVH